MMRLFFVVVKQKVFSLLHEAPQEATILFGG
jgi:hypothetical protein